MAVSKFSPSAVMKFIGLSTDTKPVTNAGLPGPKLGDEFFETDTARRYVFDGAAWQLYENQKNNAVVAVAVAPSDIQAVNFTGLYIGGTGNIKVDLMGGSTGVTFNSVPVGFFPVSVTKVYSTGTTATNMIGLNW